jgi:hypothetical protein
MSNHALWERPDIADGYGQQSALQASEIAIVERLGPTLAGARMLDLGVGPSRSTIAISLACNADCCP